MVYLFHFFLGGIDGFACTRLERIERTIVVDTVEVCQSPSEA